MNNVTDLGNLMLRTSALLCDALADQSVLGKPSSCSVYWGGTPPPDDFFCDCDDGGAGALDVYFEGFAPFDSFPQPWQFAVSAASGTLRNMASIAVKLVRPCWPKIQGGPDGRPLTPVREITLEPTLNLLIDASVVQCALLNDFTAANPDDESVIADGPCTLVRMGLLVPDRPRTGCVGFTVRFAVDLGSCCIPPC